MKRFTHILCLFFTIQGFSALPHPVSLAEMNQQFLLTFPRSGTNLASCYIQAATNKPIWFMDQINRSVTSNNRLGISLDYSKLPLFRTHHAEKLDGMNKNGNKLLFILRNYRECIHRRVLSYNSAEEYRDLFLQNKEVVKHYIANLSLYDQWEPEHRLLIRYEDLLANPVEQVAKMVAFLGEIMPDFLNEEYLRMVSEQTLDSYHEQHISTGGSHSKGKDLDYHSKQIPMPYIQDIDAAIQAHYPHLWEPYLKQYKANIEGSL